LDPPFPPPLPAEAEAALFSSLLYAMYCAKTPAASSLSSAMSAVPLEDAGADAPATADARGVPSRDDIVVPPRVRGTRKEG
jgi:hypothetical protein